MSAHEELSQLSSYLDGELTEAERTSLDAHLSGCASCRETLDALRATLGDLRLLGEAPLSERDSSALRARLVKERARESRAARFVTAAGGVAAAAIAIVAVVFNQMPQSADNALGRQPSALLAPGPSAVGLAIEESDVDYDAASARDVFDLSAKASMPADSGGGFEGAQSEGMTAPAGTGVAQDIARCEARVLAAPHEEGQPMRYLAARFKGMPALFMVYAVPAAEPSRLEMWIVARDTCETLRFEQRRL